MHIGWCQIANGINNLSVIEKKNIYFLFWSILAYWMFTFMLLKSIKNILNFHITKNIISANKLWAINFLTFFDILLSLSRHISITCYNFFKVYPKREDQQQIHSLLNKPYTNKPKFINILLSEYYFLNKARGFCPKGL